MKIEIVTGGTIYEAGVNTIKQIDCHDLAYQNLVVVPDAFSMQAEELIFDCLGIKTAFNIKVVGISKLAGTILRESGVQFERVSGIEEVFNIYKAVKMCEDKFTYFGKCDIEFCQKILQIIKQFKSCKIKPDDIKPVKNELLDSKMTDLKLVYECYESLLGDKLDLSKLLDFSAQNASKVASLKNTNLFFANFDSFSVDIFSFILKLAGSVNRICVGYAEPITQNNAYIYEDDIMKKVTAMSKEYGVNAQEVFVPTKLDGPRRVMAENLFAFNVEKGKDDFFLNLLTNDRQEEIEYVASYIRHSVFSGARFKDFAVAIADAAYYDRIREIFAKYGIVSYTDDAVNLSQTILGRFLVKMLEIAKLGFNRPTLEFLASNKLLFGKNETALNEIAYRQIDNEKKFLEKFPQYAQIVELVTSLKLCKKIEDYKVTLLDIIAFVKEKYLNLINEIDQDFEFKKASENEQSLDLVTQVIEKLAELGKGEEFSLADFEGLFMLALESVKVETIPSYIDAVFVGDVSSSYFADVRCLFVLGANAKAMPKFRADTGIIDDEDIAKLRLNFAIEPEIKVLNRRSRLKLFECLQHATEKLIVCCPATSEDKQVAQFVYDLRTMFGDNVVTIEDLERFDNVKLKGTDKFEMLLQQVGCKSNLLDAYTKLFANGSLPAQYEGALKALVKNLPKDKKYKFIEKDEAKKLLRNHVSASQLETYFACPFRHFAQYELRIKERETTKPDKRMFGSFQHRLLELFVSNVDVKNAKIEDVTQFLEENLTNIAKEIYDDELLSHKYFVKYLQKESMIILKNVLHEAKHSEFVPKFFEEKIYQKFDDTFFVGSVDRIDTYKNYFRILDYKTGAQAKVKDCLFCGKKLQLFLYAKCIKEKLKMDCSGAFYFNCQTKYQSSGSTSRLLQGLIKKDDEIVFATDGRLDEYGFKSDIVALTLKKDADKDFSFTDRGGMAEQNLDRRLDYAEKVALGGYREIKDGYIEPKPLEGVCEYCPYHAICMHREEYGHREMPQTKGEF